MKKVDWLQSCKYFQNSKDFIVLKMNSFKVNSNLLSRITPLLNQSQRYSILYNTDTKSYGLKYLDTDKSDQIDLKTKKCVYPPIMDKSEDGVLKRGREAWYNKIKRLGIVEEKIFELNMPRYYGWKVNKINEGILPYDPLPHAQYITRTGLDNTGSLPNYYNEIIEESTLNSYVKEIKNEIEQALLIEYEQRNWRNEHKKSDLKNMSYLKNIITKALCQQIHRILISNLAPSYPHLLETQTDFDPRVEAFWFFGGLERAKEYTLGKHKGKTASINEAIKYCGTPLLQLRHNLPLKEIMSFKDLEETKIEIPKEPIDLRKVGYVKTRERATIIPGFWPGDHNEFGILSYHKIGYLSNRKEEFDDLKDAVIAHAIYGSFSWLYTQACYQGFSTFHDPTYPLINQMILTNGQLWCFFVYQLNTTEMHIDCIDSNPRRNFCWMSTPMDLFESIEGGRVINLNEDVIKNLIKFYVNTPEVRKGVVMKPYLNKEKLIANIQRSARRSWIEHQYKHLMSNRERHFLTPEIYDYQRIFVHRFKHIIRIPKMFRWQMKVNPFNRRLDEHTPKYIPRCKRKTFRIKYEKTFYPTVRKSKPVLKVKQYKAFF